jgi:hypothetical protein
LRAATNVRYRIKLSQTEREQLMRAMLSVGVGRQGGPRAQQLEDASFEKRIKELGRLARSSKAGPLRAA